MVQKSTRGRPPAFDRDAVVAAAVHAFWRGGLDGTSVSDLEDATGVDRSTLYNSFGGKRGIHALAASTYVDGAEASLFAPLRDGDGGLADVVAFLGRLADMLRSDQLPPGCLIVTGMAHEERDEAATDRYLEGLRSSLQAAGARAVDRDELPAAELDDLVNRLVAGVIGVNLLAASSGLETALAHLASFAVALGASET